MFSFSRAGERRRRRCQVAFSYLPQNDDELELKVGDIIEVVGEVRVPGGRVQGSHGLSEPTCG